MYNFEGARIITGDDPRLKQKCKKISNPKAENIVKLIKEMKKTMKINNGIGLAAPQIGQPVRLFIVQVNYNQYVIINPIIKKLSQNKTQMEEGCLSFPGIFRTIERSQKIEIKYINQQGQSKKLKASGLLARAIQHEYDHLEGVIFLDRGKVN
ncbi:MAG: peptide deformylase [Candidatus Moranbacteria bacterium]|nr:peptide deformylase [Candidatus Moranbacteria bacterium]